MALIFKCLFCFKERYNSCPRTISMGHEGVTVLCKINKKIVEAIIYVEEKRKYIFLTLGIFEKEGNCARNKYHLFTFLPAYVLKG